MARCNDRQMQRCPLSPSPSVSLPSGVHQWSEAHARYLAEDPQRWHHIKATSPKPCRSSIFVTLLLWVYKAGYTSFLEFYLNLTHLPALVFQEKGLVIFSLTFQFPQPDFHFPSFAIFYVFHESVIPFILTTHTSLTECWKMQSVKYKLTFN